MPSSAQNQNAEHVVQYIDRDHTLLRYVLILTSVSLCITVDILQYSMPLAFLPSVLEDRGHSPMKIATAIGVYYWTGLLGGFLLTCYEVWKMLYANESHKVDITPFATVRHQIKTIIFNLGIGVITVFIQAVYPCCNVHTACRFAQGFVGAFLFFYVFLLNVAIFKGQQQVIAMTFASCATVIAELAGPLLGSIIFDAYGQSAVFGFLGTVSLVNQGMLVAVLYMIRPTEAIGPSIVPDTNTCEHDGPQEQRWNFWMPQPGAWMKLKTLLKDPTFICANLIITMAGVIKGSVEEMLPFHADHQWGYNPLQIGKLFCTTAIAYILASGIVAQVWLRLGRFQIGFSSQCILLLGVASWMSFHVAHYYKDENAFFGTFAVYGLCAGLTFTAAAQLIAEVVDHAEGGAKDVANGIWNTMWEAGGSAGFFLGGFLAHRYNDQMTLTTRYMICAFVTAICMIAVAAVSRDSRKPGKSAEELGKIATNGSVAEEVEKIPNYGSAA